MKKTFNLDEICCANCAAKLETAIKKIDGVQNAAINFFAQKLILELEDGNVDAVIKEVIAVCKKIEPDCKVYE